MQNENVTFSSFILSLSTSAMVHLGATNNPETQKQEEDLQLARQEINIIEILQEKCKGNLTSDEQKMIQDALFHLRMLYVEKTKK